MLVYTSVAFPLVVIAVGVANVPSVPENAATIPLGTVPPPDVSVFDELNVRFAVAVVGPRRVRQRRRTRPKMPEQDRHSDEPADEKRLRPARGPEPSDQDE